MEEQQHRPTALTIAGYDPSSGAGITADLLTLAAHGIFATSAITASTVQSTMGVFAVHPVEPEVLRQTLDCLEEDLPPDGVKLGMLGGAAAVDIVAGYLRRVRARRSVQVVLDPVLLSSSGASLLRQGAASLDMLLGLVDAVTPNLNEAAALTGLPCATAEEMERCAAALRQHYPTLAIVLTGGHLPQPSDLLLDEAGPRWFNGEPIATTSTHGTGCAFSSALLAARLRGLQWPDSVASAKQFVAQSLRDAVPHGRGRGPMALLPQLGRRLTPSGEPVSHRRTTSDR